MAKLATTSPLSGYDQKIGDIRLREMPNLGVTALAIPLKGTAKLTKALKETLSIAMPKPTKASVSTDGKTWAISTQADQLFILSEKKTDNPDLKLAKKLNDTAWATDQSDGWTALELSGPSSRAALERICQIDLDASVFAINQTARVSMEHLSSIIVRTGEDTFLLMSASSSAHSFLHAIELSAQNVS